MARRRKVGLTEAERKWYESFRPIGWHGGRNYGRDQEGEVVLAEGYTYRKELFRSDTYEPMLGPSITVSARLTMPTAKDHMKIRACCNGSISGEIIVISWRKCKSIKDAMLIGDAALKEKDWVLDRLKWYYGNHICITLPDGTPFATGFDNMYTYLPNGEYIAYSEDGYVQRVKRWSHGYGTEPYDDKLRGSQSSQ